MNTQDNQPKKDGPAETLRSGDWLGRSCVGCKYLYGQGHGYSNYTWEETTVRCALDRNQALIDGNAEEGCDWVQDPEKDNFPATRNGRCEKYSGGAKYFTLDVDGENGPADSTDDAEAIEAICKHSGRKPHGGY